MCVLSVSRGVRIRQLYSLIVDVFLVLVYTTKRNMHLYNKLFIIGIGTLLLVCIGVAWTVRIDTQERVQTHKLTTTDGYAIEVHEYPSSRPKAIVLLVPNSTDQHRDMEAFARAAQSNRLTTFVFEWRGADDNSRARFSAAQWQESVRDLESVEHFVSGQYPEYPLILIGGGFGANQAMVYTQDHAGIDMVIALSPRSVIHGVSSVEAFADMQRPLYVLEHLPAGKDAITLIGRQLASSAPTQDKTYMTTSVQGTGWALVSNQEWATKELIAWIQARL